MLLIMVLNNANNTDYITNLIWYNNYVTNYVTYNDNNIFASIEVAWFSPKILNLPKYTFSMF